MSAAAAGGGGSTTTAPPPSSAGATSGSNESVAHKLHLPWWPEGDPGKLREAASAYRAAATALTDAAEQCQRGISDVTGANSGSAITAMGAKWSGTYYGRSCLASPSEGAPAFDNAIATCTMLAGACDDYAQHIDDARHKLEELAAELVAGLVVGGLLTFVTAGLSDAAAAANAARVVTAALELADTVGSALTVVFRVGGLAVQGALIGAGSDLAMQSVRIAVEPQTTFSFGELGDATAFGAVGGPVFAGAGSVLSRLPAFAGRLGTVGTTLDELTSFGGRAAIPATAGLSGESATAVSGELRSIAAGDLATTTKVATTQLPASTNILYKGYTFTTDAEGRLASVVGKLRLVTAPKVPASLAASIRSLGTIGDQAGHFIAKIFEGPPTRFNLLPQNSNLNMGAWRSMERGWQTALKEGKDVEVEITAVYPAGATRPTQYVVEWTENGEEFTRVFENAPGGRPLPQP